MKRVVIGVLLLGLLAFAPPAGAAPNSATGFTGIWTTTDCATWWEENPDGSHTIDCSIWGDGSLMALKVGGGETPRVTFQDTYARSCDNAGSPSTRWIGAGTGVVVGSDLFATLHKTGCGAFQNFSGVELGFYHDPGSDTLWSDDGDGDGWGLVWYRFQN